MKNLVYAVLLCLLLGNCSRKAYLSPAFEHLRGGHETVAILPFEVINWVDKVPKGATLETLKQRERDDAIILQRHLYRYCLREMSWQENLVLIQHINETNDLLSEKGITIDDLKDIPKGQLANVLGVDAVIWGKVHQLYSKRGYLFRRIMNGVWGTRNQVEATFTIHQRTNGKLLWKLDYGLSIAGEDSVDEVSREVLRNVSRVFIETNR